MAGIKRTVFWGVVSSALLFGGCGSSPQDRIDAAKAVVPWIEQASTMLDGQIAVLQAAIAEAKKLLSDPNLSAESVAKYTAIVEKAEKGVAAFIDKKRTVDSALAIVEKVIAAGPTADAQFADEMRLIGQALTGASVAVPGPLGLWLKIAGGLITMLATMLAIWKTKQAAGKGTDLVNVIASVDAIMDAGLIADKGKAKELLAKRQGLATAASVKAIKDA
jgi:hypothetical protein